MNERTCDFLHGQHFEIHLSVLGGAQMTLFSPDTKIFISHYVLIPFGLEANFHITVRSGGQFHITVWSGAGFHITIGQFPLFD
jgi:hypothetical protein